MGEGRMGQTSKVVFLSGMFISCEGSAPDALIFALD